MGKIFKRVIIAMIIIGSFNNFAAVVSDNDGSAFITKAEFDSLKNNFQSQLDSYNTSIDSKIDGAIASYLSGTKIEKTSTVITNFNSINNVNNWEGIKNLKESDVIKYFGTVSKANWIYGGSSLVAAWQTATYLDNMTSVAWSEWDNPANNNPEAASQCGLGWNMSRHYIVRVGGGYGLYGNASGVVSNVSEGTYVNAADSMFSRYQFSNRNTTVWYEQRGELKFGDLYENNDTSNFRQYGSSQRSATDRDDLIKAWRKYCGCTIDVVDIPWQSTETYDFYDSSWVNNGIVVTSPGDRTTVKIGVFSASLNSGKEISFISKSNPKVILYDEAKTNYKIYPDTDLDYTEQVVDHRHATYGMTDDIFTAERVEHDMCLLVPVLAPKNIDNAGSNYFDLQSLRISKYEQLQNNKSQRLRASDGIPFAYVGRAGKGTFTVKIKNNNSSETFSEFEVWLSKKPFSSAAASDIIDISSVKVGDVDVPYIPVNQ